MKVFLDDLRPAPAGWTRVYRSEEAITLLETGEVEELSLDHDLGGDGRGTVYDVLLWIEEAVALRGFKTPTVTVHSANSSRGDKNARGHLRDPAQSKSMIRMGGQPRRKEQSKAQARVGPPRRGFID